jgi:hypothetical protein
MTGSCTGSLFPHSYALSHTTFATTHGKEFWCLFLHTSVSDRPPLLEEMTQLCTAMKISAHDSAEDLLHFTLAGLLPSDQTLIINPSTRTAILWSQSSAETTRIVAQQHFSPNGMRTLIPLLTAYPHYCAYEALLAHLFFVSVDEARQLLLDTWEIAIRPIRRAIGSLVASLRVFGLRIRNIRGAGYLVEAAAGH